VVRFCAGCAGGFCEAAAGNSAPRRPSTLCGDSPRRILDKVTAPDPDIPTGVAGATWYEVPGIWWNVVERLSWTMLGKQPSFGCQFGPVANNE